jgi:hypothetical protein
MTARNVCDQFWRRRLRDDRLAGRDVLQVRERRRVVEQIDFELLTARANRRVDLRELGRREDEDKEGLSGISCARGRAFTDQACALVKR